MRSDLRAISRACVFVVMAGWLSQSGATTRAQDLPQPLVRSVDSIRIPVRDVDRSVRFFCDVLSFERVSEVESSGPDLERLSGVFGARARTVRVRLGEEHVELVEFLVPRGRPMPDDSAANDRWFQHLAIIVRDMGEAYRHLRNHKVEHASSGPQRLPDWNQAAGGIQAFYFRDPDGHFLEILQFPPGKGNRKWHRPTDRLFLGIDHTAIVVDDTDSSLGFYRELLGFRVAGESENYGSEQEHLNSVFGARLRITTLHAATGPGLELLEYLSPRGGRPYPADSRANDLWNWQVVLRASESAVADARLRASRIQAVFASGAANQVESQGTGVRSIRDPDGHALEITPHQE